jgi:hypothetical protein
MKLSAIVGPLLFASTFLSWAADLREHEVVKLISQSGVSVEKRLLFVESFLNMSLGNLEVFVLEYTKSAQLYG